MRGSETAETTRSWRSSERGRWLAGCSGSEDGRCRSERFGWLSAEDVGRLGRARLTEAKTARLGRCCREAKCRLTKQPGLLLRLLLLRLAKQSGLTNTCKTEKYSISKIENKTSYSLQLNRTVVP